LPVNDASQNQRQAAATVHLVLDCLGLVTHLVNWGGGCKMVDSFGLEATPDILGLKLV
jgi:hypothetical protein